MWLLDAWANAEKITYPVVWEEIKDASNVIDYDIREEQTIDKSSVFTANNGTTTGMATIIPWVNAPKLIASTSIIWLIWWNAEEWTLQATADWSMYYHFIWSESHDEDITTFTLSDESWTAQLIQTADWLEIPLSWTYALEMRYQWISSSMSCTDNLVVNWEIVHSFVGDYTTYWTHDPTEQLFVILNKWDIVKMNIDAQHSSWGGWFNFNHSVTIKFTKM